MCLDLSRDCGFISLLFALLVPVVLNTVVTKVVTRWALQGGNGQRRREWIRILGVSWFVLAGVGAGLGAILGWSRSWRLRLLGLLLGLSVPPLAISGVACWWAMMSIRSAARGIDSGKFLGPAERSSWLASFAAFGTWVSVLPGALLWMMAVIMESPKDAYLEAIVAPVYGGIVSVVGVVGLLVARLAYWIRLRWVSSRQGDG